MENIIEFSHFLAVQYDKDGLPNGFALEHEKASALSWAKTAQAKQDEKEDSQGDTTESANHSDENPLSILMDKIYDTLTPYYSLVSLTTFSRSFFTISYLSNELLKPFKNPKNLIEEGSNEEGSNWKLYGASDSEARHVIKSRTRLLQIERGTQALPSSTLLSLVSAFDSIISDIAKALLKRMPHKIGKEKSINITDILSSSSIEEAIDQFITTEVYELLRGSHDDQTRYFEKTFDINIRDNWWGWADFIEIFERRNLIAHGEKNYTFRYEQICSKPEKSTNCQTVGTEIDIRKEYLVKSINILLEYSILLIFSMWRKHFKVEEGAAFEKLNEIAYNLICDYKLDIAERILKYAFEIKGTGCQDITRRMMIVNRANALKKLKRPDECEKLLNSIDWSASSETFKICVAAVKGDVPEAVKLLDIVKHSGAVSKNDIRNWPVFDDVRDVKEFQDEFARLWGEPLSSNVETKSIVDKK